MAFDLGSIAARMVLNIDDFSSKLDLARNKAQRAAVETTKAFQVGDAFKSVGTSLTKYVSVPLAAVATAAVKVGGDFQEQMNRVKAISGAAGEEFEKLKKQAIQLGADTAFSAKEAADGMEKMASAGFNVTEIMDAMPGVLDLAAVSGGDVAVASENMATALRAFGLEGTEAAHVSDVFARAAADTNAEVVDMGEAMKYIAPVANAMGISLEETAAAIGIMSDAGIKGSQAGTTLRGALTRLAKPTDAMIDSMKEMGISFYDAQGKMIPLKDQIGLLQQATANMTQEEKNRHLTTLYGQQSLSGMLALVEAGPEKLDALTESLINSDGAAKEMADTMLTGTKAALEEMGGAFESAAIIIHDILEPAIVATAEFIGNLVQKFVEADPAVQKSIVQIGALALALGPLLVGFGAVITVIAKLKVAMSIMGTGFMTMTGVIGAVVAVVFALASAFIYFYNTNETFRNFIDTLIPKIKEGLGTAFEWLKEKVLAAADAIKEFGSKVSEVASNVFDWFTEKIGMAGSTLKDVFGAAVEKVSELMDNMGGVFGKAGTVIGVLISLATKVALAFLGIQGPVGLAISLIVSFLTQWAKTGELNADGITQVFDNLAEKIVGITEIIAQYLPAILEVGINIITSLIEGITQAIPQIVEVVTNIILTLVEVFLAALPVVIGVGLQILGALLEGLMEALPALLEGLLMIIDALLNAFIEALPLILEMGMQLLSALLDGIISMLPAILEGIIQIITAILTAIVENLPKILDAGVSMLKALLEGILSVLPEIINGIITILVAILAQLIKSLPDLLKAGADLILALGEGMLTILATLIGIAATLVGEVLSKLLSFIGDMVNAGAEWIAGVAKGIANKISDAVNAAKDVASGALDAVKGFVGDMVQAGKDFVGGFARGIWNSIGDVVDAAASMARSAWDTVKGWLRISSPSKMMEDLGDFTGEGFSEGLLDKVREVKDSARAIAEAAYNEISGVKIKGPKIDLEKFNTKNLPEIDVGQEEPKKDERYQTLQSMYGDDDEKKVIINIENINIKNRQDAEELLDSLYAGAKNRLSALSNMSDLR